MVVVVLIKEPCEHKFPSLHCCFCNCCKVQIVTDRNRSNIILLLLFNYGKCSSPQWNMCESTEGTTTWSSSATSSSSCISPVAEDSWVNYVQQVHGVVVHTSHCLRVFKARVYWGAFMLIIIIGWRQQCTRDRQGQEGVFGWRRWCCAWDVVEKGKSCLNCHLIRTKQNDHCDQYAQLLKVAGVIKSCIRSHLHQQLILCPVATLSNFQQHYVGCSAVHPCACRVPSMLLASPPWEGFCDRSLT